MLRDAGCSISNNLWLNQSPFTDTRGGPSGGGGGYGQGYGQGIYRSSIDAARANAGARAGEAEYPDGYLGESTIRQESKLARNVTERMTDRAYQRGVHRGGKMPREEYSWPGDFTLMTRLQAEASPGWDGDMLTVARATTVPSGMEYLRHGGSQATMTDAQKQEVYQRLGIQNTIPQDSVIPLDPEFVKEWLPPWSS